MNDAADALPSVWDTTISLQQVVKLLAPLLIVAGFCYVWQFYRYAAHSETGGISVKSSPYFEEIPQECLGAADRHRPTNSAGIRADKFALQLRPLRIPAEKYLNPDYGRIRCLGYAMLTGLHMTDPLDAGFTDTYTDAQGKPIVRITVTYLKPFTYNPTQRKTLNHEKSQ